jgi:NAD-dependent dihydropyrimidine dehydrogenase PreA subunit
MEINTARCTGCGRCVAACPFRVLTLEVSGYRKHAALQDSRRCSGCDACLPACPVGALAADGANVSGCPAAEKASEITE